MTEYRHGGRRMIDRVLDPQFLDDLTSAPLADLRARRHEAEQEEADLSYARRLLQGRLDILRAERERRRGSGGPDLVHARSDAELVKALTAVLTDPGEREPHGLGRHLSVDPSRIGEHRREAEAAVADVSTADLDSLSPEEIDAVVDRLEALERRVSDDRAKVQHAMDALTDEVARRYRDGVADVAQALPSER